jgi:NTP pyrophosphatase (non-canonical NTP hydrolase)
MSLGFHEYQEEASETAIYPGENTIMGLAYCGLGLGEAGEVQGKIKKILRDSDGVYSPEQAYEIAKELGDALWYIAMVAKELGYDLEDIAQMNLDKLGDRRERGVLKGSGDNR